MSSYVPNYEERYYEVHPAQLRWAMHQLDSVPGYDVRGYAQGRGGMYVIVVQAPIGAPEADWRAPQPQRRRWLRFNWFRIGRGVALFAIAIALAYIAYSMFVGGAAQPQAASPAPSLWDQLVAQLPAAPNGEPVVEPVAPAIEMPWDAAGRQIGDTVDGIVRILTAGFVVSLLAVIAFMFVKVRRAFHK